MLRRLCRDLYSTAHSVHLPGVPKHLVAIAGVRLVDYILLVERWCDRAGDAVDWLLSDGPSNLVGRIICPDIQDKIEEHDREFPKEVVDFYSRWYPNLTPPEYPDKYGCKMSRLQAEYLKRLL